MYRDEIISVLRHCAFFVRESKILKRVEWFCTGVGGFYLKKGVY